MKNKQIEIKVPQLAESIEKAIVLKWHFNEGDSVNEADVLVELETDKVVLEVQALDNGVIKKITAKQGDEVKADEILGLMQQTDASIEKTDDKKQSIEENQNESAKTPELNKEQQTENILTPSARKQATKQNVSDTSQIVGSGKKGRITKEDIHPPQNKETEITNIDSKQNNKNEQINNNQRVERVVPISTLRAKVAERLVQSQQQSATLTTFNEVNMQAILDLRKNYQDEFVAKYDIKLGFMSFFTLASVEALKRFPAVNAYFEQDKIVYHDYCDIGIAMSTPRGLMVPILKDAQNMDFAKVEKAIINFAQKAKENKITVDDLTGGTFSITNGGIFGSMLSTPILNPPQSAILGLHSINQTPIAENGEVVIRPIMKLALSYDHRIIDGKEAVSFLVAIKQLIENPIRMLLEI